MPPAITKMYRRRDVDIIIYFFVSDISSWRSTASWFLLLLHMDFTLFLFFSLFTISTLASTYGSFPSISPRHFCHVLSCWDYLLNSLLVGILLKLKPRIHQPPSHLIFISANSQCFGVFCHHTPTTPDAICICHRTLSIDI